MGGLLQDGFVVRDETTFTTLPRVLLLEGAVLCLDGICLDVQKQISVLDGQGHTAWVQTTQFTYQAWLRGGGTIFRYCSPHGHRPYVHKHIYNPFGDGHELQVLELRTEDEIPTLREVIEELRTWHGQNITRLAGK